jgi:hypothetical protein
MSPVLVTAVVLLRELPCRVRVGSADLILWHTRTTNDNFLANILLLSQLELELEAWLTCAADALHL